MRRGLVLLGGVACLALLAVPSPTAAGGLSSIYVVHTSNGSFYVPSYQSILETNALTPGVLVFGDIVYLQYISDQRENSTVDITVAQTGNGPETWGNTTFVAAPVGNVTTYTLTLPSSTQITTDVMCVDGGCITFPHQTPLTLIPEGVLTIGGLDLVAFSVAFEAILLLFPLLLAARWLAKKTHYAPAFKAWLWVPHVAFGLLLLVAFDYPAFDALFAGTEFLVFPVLLDLLVFGWAIHLWNDAEPGLVLRPDPQGGHRLRFNGWTIWVGEEPDGTKVLCGTHWRDWFARLRGHAPILVAANVDGTQNGQPAQMGVTWFRPETDTQRLARFRAFRPRPGRLDPMDDFVVAGDAAEKFKGILRPKYLWFVDSDRWFSTEMPKLSWHRTVPVPAVLDGDGRVTAPATTKTKLSMPHYVDPPTGGISLAGIHYIDTVPAATGWVKAERAFRRLEEVMLQTNALRTNYQDMAFRLADEQVGDLLAMLDRQSRGLTDDEARAEMGRSPSDAEPSTDEEARPRRPTPKDATVPKGGNR